MEIEYREGSRRRASIEQLLCIFERKNGEHFYVVFQQLVRLRLNVNRLGMTNRKGSRK